MTGRSEARQSRRQLSGFDLYGLWVDAPGSDLLAYWPAMNRAEKAKWERLAFDFNAAHAESVRLRAALHTVDDLLMEGGSRDSIAEVVREACDEEGS